MLQASPIVPDVNLTELKGLIFDCDGVLINSRMANISFYNHLRGKAGMQRLSAAEEEFVHMATYEQALDHIFPGPERATVMTFLEAMESHFDYYELLQVEEGLTPMLGWLSKRNFRLGICTNRISPLEPFLKRFGLDNFFFPMQTASNSKPKPDPDGLLQVLGAWGMAQGEVAYIGDSKVDEMAAMAAGIPFWSFKNQDLAASLHINSFFELHAWLKLAVQKNG